MSIGLQKTIDFETHRSNATPAGNHFLYFHNDKTKLKTHVVNFCLVIFERREHRMMVHIDTKEKTDFLEYSSYFSAVTLAMSKYLSRN